MFLARTEARVQVQVQASLFIYLFLCGGLGSSWRTEMMLFASCISGRNIWDVMCESTLSTVNGFTNHFCNHFVLRGGAGLKIGKLYGFDGFLESCKHIGFLKIQSPQHLVMSPFRELNSESSIVADLLSQSRILLPIKWQSSPSKFAQTRRKAGSSERIPGHSWLILIRSLEGACGSPPSLLECVRAWQRPKCEFQLPRAFPLCPQASYLTALNLVS